MEETRIDRLELRLDDLAAEIRRGFQGVDARMCKIESQLDQTATTVGEIEVRLGKVETRLDQTATKVDLSDLRAEMYRMNAEIKTWMVATMVTIIGTFLVALFGLHHWNG
jgi:predicted  nucleic acid-binding Zn-ribbon protein